MQSERKAEVPTAHSLLVRRSVARRSVLVATGVTIFLLSLTLSSLVALGVRGPMIATRATLKSSSVADSSVVVSAPPAADTAGQDSAVRRIIHDTFHAAPVLISRRRVAATARAATAVTWTITPDVRSIVPAELGDLAYGFAHIEARVDASTAAHSPSAQVSGHGGQTVSQMRIAIAAVNTVLPIPVTVLSLAGLVALLLCARLLSTTRENETRLVRARGGSVRTLVLANTVEAIRPTAIGAVTGGALAQLALAFELGLPTSATEVLLAPVAVILGGIVVSAITAAAAARAANGAPRPSSGRAVVATSLSLASLLVIASAIAVWRFLQYGTPVVGRSQDVAAILAPALVLCTAALLSLILFFPITGWLQRRAARQPDLFRVLPARTLHRNPRLFAGPIALLVISIATATMAAGYSSTWNGFLSDSTRLATGSDLRATFGGVALATDSSTVLDAAAYSKLGGVDAVAPVLRESATLGNQNVTAIGVSVNRAVAVIGPSSSVLDVPELVSALTPEHDPLGGLQLPAGARTLSVAVATSSTSGSASVLTTLWLADALGDLTQVALPQQTVKPGAHPAVPHTVAVPSAGPWRIVAVDAEVTADHQIRGFTFGVASLFAETTARKVALPISDAGGWTAQTAVFNDGSSSAGPAGSIGFSRSTVSGGASTQVRLMPAGTAVVPIVVSKALAMADALHVGDRLDVGGDWASFSAQVSGIVPLVPGVTTEASLIGDLPSIDNGWLRSSEQVPSLHELWIAGSPIATIAREVADVRPAQVTVATGSVSRRFVSGAVTALWLGAIGGAAFAMVTLIASLAAIARRRRSEVGILRALGVVGRAQSRMRRTEISIVIVFGIVIGLITGAAMLLLIVGTLARSSTPEAPAVLPLLLRFDPIPLLLLVAGLVAASLVIVARYAAVIRKTAEVVKP
jgi:hypothetical protein